MKKTILIVACSLAFVSCGSNGSVNRLTQAPELKTQTDTLSWAYGQNIASLLREGYFNQLDADLIMQSARYALDGHTDQPLTPEETKDAISYIMTMFAMQSNAQATATQKDVDAQQEAYFKRLEKENPNVKRHPQGFYYEVLKQGSGPNVQYAQRILFDYRSFLLLSGEPYDQTYGHRDPILHVVGEPMFPGLIEGLQLMNPGSIYRFYFPYQLAFGPTGAGTIPGFTPLIYEVELHEAYEN